MSDKRHQLGQISNNVTAPPDQVDGLTKAGGARRVFLTRLGKWGAAATVFGLGAETIINALFGPNVLRNAQAAGISAAPMLGFGDLPPIPADQNPPPAPEPAGTVYWVATGGSDSNSGTEASPFRTWQRAYDACGDNDGIYIKAGTYYGNQTWNKPNIIMRGAPGTTREEVILQYGQSGSGGGGRVIGFSSGTSNVHLYGLTVQAGPEPPEWVSLGKDAIPGSDSNSWKQSNWKQEAIIVAGQTRDTSIINCVIRYYYYRGIHSLAVSDGSLANHESDLFPNDIEVAYCNIYGSGWDTAAADISITNWAGAFHIHHNELHGYADGVVWHNAKVGTIVEYNHIYDQFREDGCDAKRCEQANPLRPADERTVIRNNIIHDCGANAITIQRTSKRIDVFNNLCYNNGYRQTYWSFGSSAFSAIWVNAFSSPGDGRTEDIRIWGNTVYDTWGSGITVNQGRTVNDVRYPHNIEIKDNVVYNNFFGINISDGSDFRIIGNVMSHNKGGSGTGGTQYRNSRLSQSVSDNNTAYLPSGSFHWGEAGGTAYTLEIWQSRFKQDLNSAQLSGRFERTPPPVPPAQIQVSDAGRYGSAKETSEYTA